MIAVADTPDVPASRNSPTFSPDVKVEAEEAMQRFKRGSPSTKGLQASLKTPAATSSSCKWGYSRHIVGLDETEQPGCDIYVDGRQAMLISDRPSLNQ